ncbi:hypothetical protein RJ639_045770, partial [Escallonia herrerae]
MLPSSAFRLRFSILMLEFSKVAGSVPVIRLPSKFSVARTAILPREAGIGPESLFSERSKSERRIRSFPKFIGIVPEIRLLRRSKCIKEDRLAMDRGILPVIWLSAMFNTVSRLSLPISIGISPESLFPIKSRMRRNGSDEMQEGMVPVMPFQSAIVMLESRSSLHIAGEIEPVMNPVRCAFSKIGSSDSPRRLMSATRRVIGSQCTPYHSWQQSLPVHDLNMLKAALNASKAALSDGGQQLPAAIKESSIATIFKFGLNPNDFPHFDIPCLGYPITFLEPYKAEPGPIVKPSPIFLFQPTLSFEVWTKQ